MDQLKAFQILEIEPCDDLKTIKRAYAKKVREVHPEDDPQGFLRIQEAYEFLKNNQTPSHNFQDNYHEEKTNDDDNSASTIEEPDYEKILEPQNEVKESPYDYEDILLQEAQRQYLEKKTLEELQKILEQKIVSKNKLFQFLNQPSLQEILFEESFIQALIAIVEPLQLHKNAKKVLIQVYQLKKPRTELEKQLKDNILKKVKLSQMTYLLPIVVVIAINSLRLEINEKTMFLLICLLVQFVFVAAIFIVSRKKWSLSSSLFISSLAQIGIIFMFIVILVLIDSTYLDYYTDVFSGIMVFVIFFGMVCGGICLFKWIKKLIGLILK